jgi:acetoacetyl-CoA reductase/3-oxoacyl-[acyl-carrier protein] reductase
MSVTTSPVEATVRGPCLQGRVAFVTGGTRGIGAAIGHSLAEQGADVAAGYSRDRETADAFVDELAHEGLSGSAHQGNIGSAEDCRRTVAEVIDQHGRLDIQVNNAGITIDKTVLKMTDEDWYKVIAVNLSGAFFMSQAVLPHMIERGSGRIVNISSIIGETGAIGQAKLRRVQVGAVRADRDARARGRVSAQAGGQADRGRHRDDGQHGRAWVHRDHARRRPREGPRRDQGEDPGGALGRPDEIARVVHFLVADQSSFITGAIWSVNGGMDM